MSLDALHPAPTPCGTCQVRRTISRFKDRAYSGCFRRDGKLLVAGGEDAVVQARAEHAWHGMCYRSVRLQYLQIMIMASEHACALVHTLHQYKADYHMSRTCLYVGKSFRTLQHRQVSSAQAERRLRCTVAAGTALVQA